MSERCFYFKIVSRLKSSLCVCVQVVSVRPGRFRALLSDSEHRRETEGGRKHQQFFADAGEVYQCHQTQPEQQVKTTTATSVLFTLRLCLSVCGCVLSVCPVSVSLSVSSCPSVSSGCSTTFPSESPNSPTSCSSSSLVPGVSAWSLTSTRTPHVLTRRSTSSSSPP